MCLSADYADPSTREGHLTRLVHHLRNQLNTALANELWEDASETNVDNPNSFWNQPAELYQEFAENLNAYV